MPTIASKAAVAPLFLQGNLRSGIAWRHLGAEIEADPADDTLPVLRWKWTREARGVRCDMEVRNPGPRPVHLREIRLRFRLTTEHPLRRVYVQSWAMNGKTRLKEAGPETSSGVFGWSDERGARAVIAGFLRHSDASSRIEASPRDETTWSVCASVSREGATLAPGASLSLSPFLLRAGERLFETLAEYADDVARAMGVRETRPAQTGWCSWYHYYGRETFAEVMRCAEELSRSPLAPFLRTIQIDDGWNRPFQGILPEAWGDWHSHPDKFPEGMAAASAKLHSMGFRAGLWLAPFAVARNSRLFRDHPDWLLRARDPRSGALVPAPSENPEVFCLDCSHPEALAWLRETFHRVFWEWNFDYAKIDFLHYGATEGFRWDPSLTSIEAYRKGLAAIQSEAGREKFLLACGAPQLASAGLVDGMRVGPDVAGRWAFDPGWPEWPAGNCALRPAAIPSLWSQWMNGRLWQNDPDCLVVRAESTPHEREVLGLLGMTSPSSALRLSLEEAGFWMRLVWLCGGASMLSEVWSELPPDRRNLLLKCFPPNPRPVLPLDWFECPDTAILLSANAPPLLGFFNLGETPWRPEIPAEKLGLPGHWTLRERWSGEIVRGSGNLAPFPLLPPRSARVWEGIETRPAR